MPAGSILVADDDEQIVRLTQLCLTNAGHAVECASTGNEAAKLLQHHPFDLLITDVHMPDGDGLDLIMRLTKVSKALRILVITGGGKYFQATDCAHTAKSLGAHATLLKPFNRTQLFEAIDRAIPAQAADAS